MLGPTTLVSWVRLIAAALEERGIDPRPLLRRASVSPEILTDPDARCSTIAVQRLWDAGIEITRDPCFGLAVGAQWHPTSFHAVGYAALASRTLYDVLELIVRYARVVSSGADLRLLKGKSEVALRLKSRIPQQLVSERAMHAATLAAFASIAVLCARAARTSGLLRVTFRQSTPPCKSQIREFFGCTVLNGEAENRLVFSRARLEKPLATENQVLRTLNERIIVQYLRSYDASSFAERVSSELLRSMPTGNVAQANIARALFVTTRTLQRRLRAERTTFRQMLDGTRRYMAELYSDDRAVSGKEIAYLLGFSDERSLWRARSRWRSARK
jgi:hypothetical protein